jgi:hypothetical protein
VTIQHSSALSLRDPWHPQERFFGCRALGYIKDMVEHALQDDDCHLLRTAIDWMGMRARGSRTLTCPVPFSVEKTSSTFQVTECLRRVLTCMEGVTCFDCAAHPAHLNTGALQMKAATTT